MPCARAEQVRAGILPWGGGRLDQVQPIFVWLCFFGGIRQLRVVPQCAAPTGRRWCEAPDGRGEAGNQGAAKEKTTVWSWCPCDGGAACRVASAAAGLYEARRYAGWCMKRGGMPAWCVTVERRPASGSACAAVEGGLSHIWQAFLRRSAAPLRSCAVELPWRPTEAYMCCRAGLACVPLLLLAVIRGCLFLGGGSLPRACHGRGWHALRLCYSFLSSSWPPWVPICCFLSRCLHLYRASLAGLATE